MPENLSKSEAIAKSADPADQIKGVRTIYDVGWFEIFWRNFLAGMARALGGLLVTLILVTIVATIVSQFILPLIQPYLDGYLNLFESLNSSPLNSKGLQKFIQ